MENTLIEKIISVQETLKAPKGRVNKFGNYNYRSCEDILEAVKPLLAKQGLLLTLTDEPILIGDWHYIKATARVTDGKEEISTSALAREAEDKKGMDPSQITGTSSSYARKYCLNALFLIDDTKDADTDEYANESKKKAERAPKDPTPEEKGRLIQRAKALGMDINDILKQADWKEGTKLSMDSYIKAGIILDEIEASRRES